MAELEADEFAEVVDPLFLTITFGDRAPAGPFLDRMCITCSGFLFFRSGSGAQVSDGRWSDGSMTRPSLPMIGPRSRSFPTSRSRCASLACSGVSNG